MRRIASIALATLLMSLAACAALREAPAHGPRRIALSFDDVPRAPGAFMTPAERTRRLIGALRRAGVRQAGFFVTTANLDKPDGQGGEDRIRAYVAAGHVIANHSHGHGHLSKMSAADYLADLDRAAAWLKGRPGLRPWFRYPFLDEGYRDVAKRDALRAGLRERGLRNGYITADSQDWLIDGLVLEARARAEAIDRAALRDLYVDTIVRAADGADAVATRALGRSPAQVVLLHETDLAALFIADAVAALRRDGWEIVPIDEAYRDPIAASEPDTVLLHLGRAMAVGDAAGIPRAELFAAVVTEETVRRLFAEKVLAGRRASARS